MNDSKFGRVSSSQAVVVSTRVTQNPYISCTSTDSVLCVYVFLLVASFWMVDVGWLKFIWVAQFWSLLGFAAFFDS